MGKHKIRVAENVLIELDAQNFTDLHDRMTDYYNKHYKELTKD